MKRRRRVSTSSKPTRRKSKPHTADENVNINLIGRANIHRVLQPKGSAEDVLNDIAKQRYVADGFARHERPEDMARALDCSVATVWRLFHRAVTRLEGDRDMVVARAVKVKDHEYNELLRELKRDIRGYRYLDKDGKEVVVPPDPSLRRLYIRAQRDHALFLGLLSTRVQFNQQINTINVAKEADAIDVAAVMAKRFNAHATRVAPALPNPEPESGTAVVDAETVEAVEVEVNTGTDGE